MERKSFIWFLEFSTKYPSIRINKNVGKQTQNTQLSFGVILAWQKSEDQSSVWIVQNDVHIAEISTKRTTA